MDWCIGYKFGSFLDQNVSETKNSKLSVVASYTYVGFYWTELKMCLGETSRIWIQLPISGLMYLSLLRVCIMVKWRAWFIYQKDKFFTLVLATELSFPICWLVYACQKTIRDILWGGFLHFTSTSSYPADVGASAKYVVALHGQKQDRVSNVGRRSRWWQQAV